MPLFGDWVKLPHEVRRSTDGYGNVEKLYGVIMTDTVELLTKLKRVLHHTNGVRVWFSLDADGNVDTDEVCILLGDCNCHHGHEYHPETYHGYTEIVEEWGGGPPMASLDKAITRALHIVDGPSPKCRKCKKQVKRLERDVKTSTDWRDIGENS
jgi:hypothetical protein